MHRISPNDCQAFAKNCAILAIGEEKSLRRDIVEADKGKLKLPCFQVHSHYLLFSYNK